MTRHWNSPATKTSFRPLKVPKYIRDQLRERLWALADDARWLNLNDRERADLYVRWSRDQVVEELLLHYMDRAEIRVYLKDSVLKPYPRERLSDPAIPAGVLGLEGDLAIEEKFIKPHGIRLSGGDLICWGAAEKWKAILLACFERSWGRPTISSTRAVLLNSIGQFADTNKQRLVEDVAKRLDVSQVVWHESIGID